jgi:hypothetical protein
MKTNRGFLKRWFAMRRKTAACVLACILVASLHAQDAIPGGMSSRLTPPSVNAKLTFGFNYDLLRAPTDVSFDYAKGYAALNFPLDQGNFISKDASDDLWKQMSDQLGQEQSSGEQFKPQAGARQYANSTIRVDVPMLGGVASFSNTQNMYLNFLTVLGNTNLLLSYDTTMKSSGLSQTVKLFLRGAINVPIDATIGWETMTFGYAYKINKDLVVAANLHRHIFRLDILAKMDVDLLGYFKIDQDGGSSGSQGGALSGAPSLKQSMDYTPAGEASGHYEAEAWSTSFGLKYWRFTLTSRFGVDTKAKGRLTAKYSLPFFVTSKFQIDSRMTDPTQLMSSDMLNAIQQNKMDSVVYTTNEDATWRMPQAHTLTFDIIPSHLSLSYTKLFGNIEAYHVHAAYDSADMEKRYVDLDAAISVDHIIMLSVSLWGAFVNLGVFALDMRIGDQSNIIGSAIKSNKQIEWMRIGDAAMLPVLNLGAAVGSKVQLGFELDLLPLQALKVGMCYPF